MTLCKTLTGALVAAALTSTSSFAADLNDLQKQIDELKVENSQILANLENTSSSAHSSNTTTIGGYGELHYNNLSSDITSADKKSIDFHRFVLFFGHEFNNDIRFYSEFELEHSIAGESKNGEVELEQAYIEFDTSDSSNIKAGIFLIPVGQINETHEPPAFYGVERNPVEKNIIPATWWEAGAMYSANTSSGISYDLAIHSGLSNNEGKIRDARQKVSKAPADSLAYTARIKYTGITGLELAGTIQYQSDFSQGTGTTGDAEDGTLLEAHAVYTTGGLKLSALYASWDINFEGGTTTGKDTQNGSIIEASYKFNSKWGIFARQNNWTNDDGATDKAQTDIGVNYWPHESVVLKADYQAQNDEADDFDGINLGVGYQF